MENAFAKYQGISACWIEKCTFSVGIVAMALIGHLRFRAYALAITARNSVTTAPLALEHFPIKLHIRSF
jgi:hypothetical protein